MGSQVQSLPAGLLELAVVIKEVESDVTVLLCTRTASTSNDQEGLGLSEERGEGLGRHTGLTEG